MTGGIAVHLCECVLAEGLPQAIQKLWSPQNTTNPVQWDLPGPMPQDGQILVAQGGPLSTQPMRWRSGSPLRLASIITDNAVRLCWTRESTVNIRSLEGGRFCCQTGATSQRTTCEASETAREEILPVARKSSPESASLESGNDRESERKETRRPPELKRKSEREREFTRREKSHAQAQTHTHRHTRTRNSGLAIRNGICHSCWLFLHQGKWTIGIDSHKV